MTKSSRDYIEFVMEQLSSIQQIQSGRFFGGIGLSADGVQFAMLMHNSLYFVVSDKTRPKYQKMGSHCFWYTTKRGRVDVKKYYEVPGEIIDDQEQLALLASESIHVAREAKKTK